MKVMIKPLKTSVYSFLSSDKNYKRLIVKFQGQIASPKRGIKTYAEADDTDIEMMVRWLCFLSFKAAGILKCSKKIFRLQAEDFNIVLVQPSIEYFCWVASKVKPLKMPKLYSGVCLSLVKQD